jgi:glucose-6-phosphate isomerase
VDIQFQSSFFVGDKSAALEKSYAAYLPKAREVVQKIILENYRFAGICSEASSSSDISEIHSVAASLKNNFDTIVIIGTGGSSLGGRFLSGIKQNMAGKSSNPELIFLENVDPMSTSELLENLNFKSTCFIAVSKSGSTMETLSLLLIFIEAFKQRGFANLIPSNFLALTENKPNILRKLADSYGMKTLEHDSKIGGRYSFFSNVVLLPGAIVGLDAAKIRESGNSVVQNGTETVAEGAALNAAAIDNGYSMNVLMPYADKLFLLGLWYRQLWAESIGKNGKGSTPIEALGTVDQHSQLQLYLDGPKDKFFTFITLDNAGKGAIIPATAFPESNYLSGNTIGDLMNAEQEATIETMRRRGCPSRIISLESTAEDSVGKIAMQFMLETVATSALIGVDPFTQPAVEDGKIITRELLHKDSQLPEKELLQKASNF